MPEIDYTPYPNIRPGVAAPDVSWSLEASLSMSEIRGLERTGWGRREVLTIWD
jgi:hypothetical protein